MFMTVKITVAPYAGAWIETIYLQALFDLWSVAPYAGAWIETFSNSRPANFITSLPTRERGLKL